MKNPIGLYIHVPFCLSKCPYCDFYSTSFDSEIAEAYTRAVLRAIEKSPRKSHAADTVYFGGGTPALLGAKNLSRILETAAKYFRFTPNPEITLEANPAAALELPMLRRAGFNRISFGAQSGIDAELEQLGRLHRAEDARRSILAAKDAGFENISADLMLGIPCQTGESLRQSIGFLAGLPLSHISAYMLKIEEGTPFAIQGKSKLCPDEDALAEMYLGCVNMLSALGFKQYEISNFAKNGARSRHNLKYWQLREYIGIGPSAHSFIDGLRYFFPRDLGAFIKAENPYELAVPDGEGGGFEEYAMLRLRLCEGLDLQQAKAIYNIEVSGIAEKARVLERNRLLKTEGDVVALTPEGFLVSNSVTTNLLF